VLLRRALTGVPPIEGMEMLLGKLKQTKTNIEFLLTVKL
jgi:transcription termination factor Rho